MTEVSLGFKDQLPFFVVFTGEIAGQSTVGCHDSAVDGWVENDAWDGFLMTPLEVWIFDTVLKVAVHDVTSKRVQRRLLDFVQVYFVVLAPIRKDLSALTPKWVRFVCVAQFYLRVSAGVTHHGTVRFTHVIFRMADSVGGAHACDGVQPDR